MRDLLSSKPTPEMITEACERIGLSRSQLYRLMSLSRENPTTVTLVPSKGGRSSGKRLLSGELEAIIKKEIDTVYLNRQKPKLSQLYRSIKHACHGAGLQPPALNTIRRRVEQIPKERRVREREGDKAADDRFRPVKGSMSSERPLGLIQLDHTLVDAFVVDSESRQPLCRPWLTLAIDIATRMVYGMYLALEAPSSTSLAMTMLHGAVPKAPWLKARGIDAPWPIHGVPEVTHSDNGKDFKSKAFDRGCLQFGIAHKFRPVKQPSYGGHIERLIGSMMGEIHMLPGSTFSSIADKGSYDAEKHAALTFQELEQWLAVEILKYHSTVHRGIGMTPLAAWNRAVSANFRPRIVDDEYSFTLAFLPATDRSVTREGIARDGLYYQAPVLSA
jgi:putative transposase